MKTAIKIVALVEAIACIVAAFSCLVAGIVLLVLSAQNLAQFLPEDAPAEAAEGLKWGLIGGGIGCFIAIPYLVVATIFCFISKKLAQGETIKDKFITWGVLDIVFASAPVGVLLILEGAIHGNRRVIEE